MARFADWLSRVRLVYKRSSLTLKIMVLCAIVVSIVTLSVLGGVLADQQAQTEAMRQQAGRLEQENQDLEDKIDNLGSVDSVEDIAKEELGLVDPDTVIIDPEK